MNVLHVVGGLPSEETPHNQPFIKSQIDSLILKGINIEILDLKGYKSPFNYFISGKHIKQIVNEKNIQIIHAHYAYCGLTTLLGKTRLPIVLSLLGSDLQGKVNYKGNITLRGKLDRLTTRIISKFVKHVIVKSDKMKGLLSAKINIDVIPNGVNFDVFKPCDQLDARKKLSLKPETFYVLFLANPKSPVKNFALAQRSFKHFLSKLGTSENVEFLSIYGLPHNEIVKYLNACDLLLFTSFWEGSPNVIKEAMACNLPIISTDVGDVKEIIKEATNCFVVDYDAEKIAEHIKYIYNKRERSNGREKIEHLNEERIADRIISVYIKCLGN